MKHDYAIAALDNQAKIVENNELVNRREGDTAQADLERRSGHDFRQAIRELKKRQRAPKLRS